MRRVERERARLDLADREVTLGTREALGEEPLAAVAVGVGHKGEALPEPQRGLDRIGEPRALRLGFGAAPDDETIDDDLDGVLLHLVERDVLGKIADETVHANAGEPAAPRGREELLVLTLAVAHERAEYEDPRAFGHRADLVDDLLYGLRDDRDPVIRAMRNADPREEKTQVVVDLGHGPDGRPRVARRTLLVDRHGGRQSLDEVDIGLLHLTEELARVRGQRFDIAALALRIDRVECE